MDLYLNYSLRKSRFPLNLTDILTDGLTDISILTTKIELRLTYQVEGGGVINDPEVYARYCTVFCFT